MATCKFPDPYEQPTMRVPEAGKLLGYTSKDQAYRAVKSGNLPAIELSPNRKVVSTFTVYQILNVPLPEPLADRAGVADTHPAQAGE